MMRSLPASLIFLLLLSVDASAQRYFFNGVGAPRAETKVQVLRTDSMGVEINFSLNSLDVDPADDGFANLKVSGLSPVGQPGRPDVLTTGKLIAVPAGYEAQVKVLEHQTSQVAGINVAPFQKKYRCECEMNGHFEFDGALYDSNEAFPAQAYSFKKVGNLQGVDLYRFAINPIQTQSASNQLTVTSSLRAHVSLKKVTNAKPLTLGKSIYQLVRQTAANGEQAATAFRVADQEGMIIVVADEYADNITELVQWERQKGLNVTVATRTEAGGTKEDIKDYIQAHYDAAEVKPSYLVFIGNEDTMPPFFESTGSGPAATDYTFALLTGDDAIPDALYGRIVADDLNDLNLQISRWVNYQRTPEPGNWYPQGATIASNEGFNPSDAEYAERVATSLKANTYNLVDAFEQEEENATEENITNALIEGRSWISYFGHGSGTSWGSVNDTFNVGTVDSLTNDTKLPIVIDVACTNASYAKIDRSFGEAWVKAENDGKNAGAVAFYGGSVVISWHPPAIMSEGIAKYHFEKPVHTLGGSVLAGQLYLVEQKGTESDVIDNIKWYNLFGDPSLLVRTATPQKFNLTTQTEHDTKGIRMQLKATSTDGEGLSDVQVALSHPEQGVMAVGTTNATGDVILNLPGVVSLGSGSVLTASGYNLDTVVHSVGTK